MRKGLTGDAAVLRRQGALLTGHLAAVEDASNGFVNDLALSQGRFVGSALYLPSNEFPDELIVVHAHNPEGVSADHLDYVDRNLRRRRVSKAETSAGQSQQCAETRVVQSRQVAGHTCLNYVFDIKSGALRGQSGVFQLVFDHASGGVIEAEAGMLVKRCDAEILRGGALGAGIGRLAQDFGGDLASEMHANPPTSPNAFVIYSDITGYRRMVEQEGEAVAFEFARRVQETIEQLARKYEAEFFREEGDGFWVGCAIEEGASDMQFERPLQLINDMYSAYKRLRSVDVSRVIYESYLKICIAAGHVVEQRIGPPFASKARYDSLAHSLVRTMGQAAPRDRDCVLVTPETVRLLRSHGVDLVRKADTVDVPSTFISHVDELML